MAASLQVSNPVIGFSGDNNGVMLQLPAVAVSGAPSATGTLYFGVDTQSNNALGTAKAFPTTLDGNGQAVIATSYKSSSYGSFLDSGSNGLFFPDATINTCTVGGGTWFCPAGTLALSATLSNASNSNSSVVSFGLGNGGTLLSQGYSALPGLARLPVVASVITLIGACRSLRTQCLYWPGREQQYLGWRAYVPVLIGDARLLATQYKASYIWIVISMTSPLLKLAIHMPG